jgi:CheY-like chemotaxis protein
MGGVGQPKVLLLVEDDSEMRSLLCEELGELGCRIVEAADGNQAVEQAQQMAPHLIVTDLRMPAGGLNYLGRLRLAAPWCPIILMTAFGDPRVREAVQQFGVAAYFDKPIHLEELKAVITRLLSGD